MYIVHVHIHVKLDYIDDFLAASLENARKSILEPGIARFDIIQQIDDSSRFELIEVYRTTEDPANHKNTLHYNQWCELVEPMLAEPRTRTIYSNLFPDDQGW
jgi:autoinducer 2-degrading protein